MTTIPAGSRPTPLQLPRRGIAITDKFGMLTQYGVDLLQSIRDHVNGGNRVIPCSSTTATNLITLTPNDSTPLLEGYIDYEVFVFAADAGSTGSVTATVVPTTGALDTLKVYKSDGATQAGSGDIVADSVYMLIYAEHLDTDAGGFVLK